MTVSFIPAGYHTITPYLVVEDVEAIIDFLKLAFNAEVVISIKDDNGGIVHGEIKIGDSVVMIGGIKEGVTATTTMLYLYTENTDVLYQQALAAGGTSLMEPADQFYGDRNAGIADPSGNQWWIATHIEDMSAEEAEKRSQTHKAASNPG